HTPGPPSAPLPETARQHLFLPLDRTKAWTRLSYPDMTISIPAEPISRGDRPEAPPHPAASAPGRGEKERHMAGPFYHPPSPPQIDVLNITAPKPPAPPAPAAEKASQRTGIDAVPGMDRVRRRRQRQKQQQQQQQQRDGAGAGQTASMSSGARLPPPLDMQDCSIEAAVGPVINVLQEHAAEVDKDLKRNAEFRAQAEKAVRSVRQHLTDVRHHMTELDQQRTDAASRAEYSTAAALRSRLDELAVQATALELTICMAQDHMDAMAEIETTVRQRESGQLLAVGLELRSLVLSAEQAIHRLQAELRRLQARLHTATEARAVIGQVMSMAIQSTEVRQELRALADAAMEVEKRAAADLEADRAVNRAVLADAAALASNLTSAGSLVRAASLQVALLRGQLELALQMQDYEHAGQVSAAIDDLKGAEEEGAQSMVTMEKLLAAHEAVVRQRLADFKHHLAGLERASQIAHDVRDLRDMYDSGEVDNSEALALATKLAAALEELRVSEPPRLMGDGEAEAVVREVLA
ncbi:hypothetical protein Vretimale_16502, partial [Volvox reticuliferus]